jgi:hypothetical protein
MESGPSPVAGETELGYRPNQEEANSGALINHLLEPKKQVENIQLPPQQKRNKIAPSRS